MALLQAFIHSMQLCSKCKQCNRAESVRNVLGAQNPTDTQHNSNPFNIDVLRQPLQALCRGVSLWWSHHVLLRRARTGRHKASAALWELLTWEEATKHKREQHEDACHGHGEVLPGSAGGCRCSAPEMVPPRLPANIYKRGVRTVGLEHGAASWICQRHNEAGNIYWGPDLQVMVCVSQAIDFGWTLG